MASKKILFVIVEGPSDKEALGTILEKYYSSNKVFVHVMHCDITTQKGITPTNIRTKISDKVKEYASSNHFLKKDFERIIHIIDMDGAYISDDRIIFDECAFKIKYTETAIYTNNVKSVILRNQIKQRNLNILSKTSNVWTNLPYEAYYMSCNLDHVLYGKLNTSDEEKKYNSIEFAEKYQNDISIFFEFMCKSSFSICSNYIDSWNFIKKDNNSLKRYSNLGIFLKLKTSEE